MWTYGLVSDIDLETGWKLICFIDHEQTSELTKQENGLALSNMMMNEIFKKGKLIDMSGIKASEE